MAPIPANSIPPLIDTVITKTRVRTTDSYAPSLAFPFFNGAQRGHERTQLTSHNVTYLIPKGLLWMPMARQPFISAVGDWELAELDRLSLKNLATICVTR